jgi:hypothetical protein
MTFSSEEDSLLFYSSKFSKIEHLYTQFLHS